jgi:hypothetical protein
MFFQSIPTNFYIETIHKKYTAQDPVFFDLSQEEWVKRMEADAEIIIKELAPIFEPDFEGLTVNFDANFQFPPKIWKGYPFYFNGFTFEKRLKKYPLLAAHLSKIPNLITASISVLEPGAWLLPHNGNSNGVMRWHTGLKVPAKMPDCGFIIDGQQVSWEVGKSFAFCNMYVHSAHNKTNQRRYVLLLDVVRPEFTHIKKLICVHTIARILTDKTADMVRLLIGYRPKRVIQDPAKGLSYVANKPYAQKTKQPPLIWFLSVIENWVVLKLYILILSVIFIFKKLQ